MLCHILCAKVCLPTAYFTSSQCVLKRDFPKFIFFFFEMPGWLSLLLTPIPNFCKYLVTLLMAASESGYGKLCI